MLFTKSIVFMFSRIMRIFLAVLFFHAIFGKSGVAAADGYEYAWTMNSYLRVHHRDFEYELTEEKDIFGSVVSLNNQVETPFLRLGEFYTEVLASRRHKSTCKRLPNDAHLDEYNTKLHIYGDGKDGFDADILSYFTFFEREVWECDAIHVSGLKNLFTKTAEDSKSAKPPIKFYRIVNGMHGIRPINKVFYFDGVEVMRDACPVQTAHDLSSLQTITFREIKYIDPSSRKTVRYLGKIYLTDEDTKQSIFETVEVTEPKLTSDGKYYTEELDYLEKGNVKTQIVGTEGETIKIGNDNFVSTLGSGKQEAVCELVKNSELLYTENYLPRCLVLINPSEKDRKFSEMYGLPPKKFNVNFFSVISQESWKCSWAKDKFFMRRVTEVVGSIPVAKIEYFSGVNVWKYKLKGNSYGVKLREIYYHTTDNVEYQIRYNGIVKLKIPEMAVKRKGRIEPYRYSNL
ncbi:uncharacterized protein LOC111048095 isoform X2 [Nilaparvata lugens]|uniref:uncharacterized protein LOC111048095 isoform X2 n=1 Tax=Nilaparvata lugens TaxID=108931 RepID=UPI00193E9573|nr:uncharacterized protein LOC111048095 isoform X2 [Nilaparvata lugens]